MVSTWNGYLRLYKNEDGTASLEVCQYEVLAEVEYDEDGNELPVPEYIDGERVEGVEDGYIVGGKLGCSNGDSLIYGPDEIDLTVKWLKTKGFEVDGDLIAELQKAVHKSPK
jgi:hypothetical protein